MHVHKIGASTYDRDFFHLDSLSGARNKGVLMSNFFDLDGIARDNEPDLGAYEYVSPTNLKRR